MCGEAYVYQVLDFMFLKITTDLRRQQDTRSGTEFTVLLVQFALKNEFFKVDESHGHRGFLVSALILSQLPYLPFQAAQGERREKEEGGRRKV